MLRAGRREVEWNFRSGGVAGGEGKEGAGNSELDTEWVGFLKKRNFFASLEKKILKKHFYPSKKICLIYTLAFL